MPPYSGVADLEWIGWPIYFGLGGRFGPEYADEYQPRNTLLILNDTQAGVMRHLNRDHPALAEKVITGELQKKTAQGFGGGNWLQAAMKALCITLPHRILVAV